MLATCALLVMLRATAPQQSPTEVGVAAVTPTPSHPHVVFIVSDGEFEWPASVAVRPARRRNQSNAPAPYHRPP